MIGLVCGIVSFELDVQFDKFDSIEHISTEDLNAMDSSRFHSPWVRPIRYIILITTMCAVSTHVIRHYFRI